MDGYKEAHKIDLDVSKIFHREPITPANATQWLNFARTVKTSMIILEEQAKAVISDETMRLIKERRDKEEGA